MSNYYKKTNTKPEESFDLGYVVWGDANGDSGRATHEPHHAPIPLLTAGVLVKNDTEGVTVAMDFSAEGSFRETRFIPRANIHEVRVLQKDACRRSPQWAMFPAPTPQKRKRKSKGKK